MTRASGVMRRPKMVRVNRTEFRAKQRELLNKAKGNTVVEITGDDDSEKLVLDKKYFDELFRNLNAYIETLQVTMDKRLMAAIMSAASTLNDDVNKGKLLTMDEVFSEE